MITTCHKEAAVIIKSIKKILVLINMAVLIIIVAPKTSQADEKVVRVTIEQKMTNSGKQYALIRGKTQSGSTVWKFKTSKQPAAELDASSIVVKGKNVYVIDSDTYIRLKKSTGKVIAKNKFGGDCAGSAMAVDEAKNLYVIGYYSSTLYKLGRDGNVIWKHKFSSSVCWAYKIIVKDGMVTVVFDQGGKRTIDADTGN